MKSRSKYTFILKWRYCHIYRIFGLSLISIAIMAITLFSFNSCFNSGENTVEVPEYLEIGPSPLEITVDQLYSEYMADETVANSKYYGRRLLFNNLEVEEIFGRDYTDNHGHITYVKEWFIIGNIKFKLRDFGIMQNIEEGFVLNVVGECCGLLKGFIYIEDCWVESIVGDLGTSEWEGIY